MKIPVLTTNKDQYSIGEYVVFDVAGLDPYTYYYVGFFNPKTSDAIIVEFKSDANGEIHDQMYVGNNITTDFTRFCVFNYYTLDPIVCKDIKIIVGGAGIDWGKIYEMIGKLMEPMMSMMVAMMMIQLMMSMMASMMRAMGGAFAAF